MKENQIRRQHLLIISQYFYPEEFRINDICCEWVKRGYEITVLTGIPNYPAGKFYNGYGVLKKRIEIWNGIRIIRIPILPRGKSSIGLIMNYLSFVVSGFIWNMFTRVKADKVFIFEVSPMTQALNGIWYAKKRKIPCYLYVQDLWPESIESVTGIHSKLIIKPIEKMVCYIYRNCSLIFATSKSFANEIKKYITEDSDKVLYWPQYAEEFYKPEKLTSVKSNAEEFKIVFTGNIGIAQGLEVLPTVARVLKEVDCHVKFLLVGEGRNKKQLKRKIEEEQVAEYFEFRDRVPPEQVPQVLAEGELAFVSFMNSELFSNTIPAKLQTYMACGMPILAVASGETERIVYDSQCGINCGIGNIGEIAEAIITLKKENRKVLEQMGKNGRRYCERHFQKKMLMDEMDLYLNS